jgi:small-conductance mechanosensitive channel
MGDLKMDENFFKLGDRVVVANLDNYMDGKKGTVVYTFGLSSEVKLDVGITIITSFDNLKKLTKKKKSTPKKVNKKRKK